MAKKKIVLPVSADVPVELSKALPLPPTTTEQEDITKQGQREVNLLWENTQSAIARYVILVTILADSIVSVILVIVNRDPSVGQLFGLSFLNVICGVVISFYFSRTNHEKIGGVGSKATDQQDYKGR